MASTASAEEAGGAPQVLAAAPAAEVVVIGARERLLKQPGSGSTIEAQDLRRARVFTVNEALRQVPGVFPRDEEGFGIRPNIGLRGLNPTRSTKVLLLEDGLPLTFAPYGDNASYYHPPIERFARIEVLKGSSQIRFGPQTVGGVINYITPRAPDTLQAQASVTGGNRDYVNLDGSLGMPLLGGRTYVHVNHKETASPRENQDLKITDIFAKGEWALGADHAVTIRLNRFAEDSQITYSGLRFDEFLANPFGNPFLNDSFQTERYGASLTHAWGMAEGIELKTTVYGSVFDRAWWRQSSNSGQRPNDASDPACGGLANLSTTCGNEGRVRYYGTFGAETRLALDHAVLGVRGETEVGLRAHFERQDRVQINGDTPRARSAGTGVNGGLKEDNERDVDAYSAFLLTRLPFGPLTIEPGLRIEHIRFERLNKLNGATGSTELTEVIPGVGAVVALSEEVALYAGVHKGFAPPRVEDILSNSTGATLELDAEQSVNYEAGVRGTLAAGLYLDAAFFHMDFTNQIIPTSVAGGVGATLTSAGETRHTGGELHLNGSLREAGLLRRDDLFFRTSLTYVPVAEFSGSRFSSVSGFSGVSVSGNRLPYAPEWLVSAALGYDWRGIVEAQIEVQRTGRMFTDDLNTIPVTADGQRGLIEEATVWNAAVNIHPPGTPVTLFFTVKNAFDTLYVVDRSRGILPGAPRLVQGGVSVRF